MTKSPVERMTDAFVTYAKAQLPGLITQANVGKTVAAPALKKIEKTVKVDTQYFPSAAINLDSVELEEAGPGALRVDATVDLVIFASDSKPDRLSAFIDRYLDAAVDLAADGPMLNSEFYLRAERADKGIEADGTRGWAMVAFTIWGEVNF